MTEILEPLKSEVSGAAGIEMEVNMTPLFVYRAGKLKNARLWTSNSYRF